MERKEKLHPGTRVSFRIKAYLILIGLILVLMSNVIRPLFKDSMSGSMWGIVLFVGVIGVIVFGEVYSRMAYNRWFYVFTNEGLKTERGIIWKTYSNIPYNRIQNVEIQRGIVARIFGFSSLKIQTAGFSGSKGAEGSIPGIEEKHAVEIRDFILKKINSQNKDGN